MLTFLRAVSSYFFASCLVIGPHFLTSRTTKTNVKQKQKRNKHVPLFGHLFVCLFIFGYYKSKLTGQQPIKGALRVTFIGIVAALAAYVIASLVKQ